MSDKKEGFFNKYTVRKNGNASKKIDAVVLEFDDPIARVGIDAWRIEMLKNGYIECSNSVGARLHHYGHVTKTPQLEAENAKLKKENARLTERIEEMEYYIPKIGKDSQDARGEINQLKEEIKKRDNLFGTILTNLKQFSINTPNIHSFLTTSIESILNGDKDE